MHNRKFAFLNMKYIQKNANEKHSLDLNITESNPHGDNEERSHRSLIKPEFSTQWPKPWSWHTSSGDRKDGVGYGSLSWEVEDNSLEKNMKTLTPKGVFIGFPTKLK